MEEEKKETILFVDDEESILDIANEYFQQKGYEVITATNGARAVEILKNVKIDCCFTDINMPEMDGLELAGHIWKMDNTIPVIIMTGYPTLDNTIQTLKNGVVDFLIKPVNLKQMELSVKRVLHQRRLFIDNVILKQEVEKKKELERLNLELNIKVGELNTLNRIMQDFTEIDRTFDVFHRLVAMSIEISNADEARFYVVSMSMQKPFEIAASFVDWILESEKGHETLRNEERERVESLIMKAAKDRTPLLISENKGTDILPESVKSLMIVPLSIRDRIFGILTTSVLNGSARFIKKDLYYLSFMTRHAAYSIENLALYDNIYENLLTTLLAFVKTIEVRDSYTERHSNSVAGIAVTIGTAMKCTSEELYVLNVAGLLHDIGKIGIQDEILLKPGRLTSEEFEVIKKHPVIGADIIDKLGFWDREQKIVRHHHERYDGTGYPDSLLKNEIPLLSRILAVADVYDALASTRIYRKKMEESKILRIINEGSGTQFDPDVVAVFQDLYREGKIRQAYV